MEVLMTITFHVSFNNTLPNLEILDKRADKCTTLYVVNFFLTKALHIND